MVKWGVAPILLGFAVAGPIDMSQTPGQPESFAAPGIRERFDFVLYALICCGLVLLGAGVLRAVQKNSEK